MEDNAKMVGGLVMLAMAIIVGAILLQGSAQNINDVVNKVSVANQSFGVATNGTAVTYNYKTLSDVVIVNYSNGAVVPSNNYTVSNGVVSNGAVVSTITPNASAAYRGYSWNVTYTAEPVAYGDSGSRAMTNLIVILMGLALAAVAIGYAVKSYTD